MKTISSLLLSALLSLPSLMTAAEAEPAKIPAKEADAALAKLAATKKAAVLMLNVKDSEGRFYSFVGVFISKDGLALVNLSSLARKEKPKVYTGFDEPLEFGTILGVFPEQELALMKFNHRPKVWLDLAPEEPALGETVAIVPLNMMDPWEGMVPPIIGPIMAKRSDTTANLRVQQFKRVMSVGSGLSAAQREGFVPGIFAVDRKGRLIAFTSGIQTNASQSLILVSPVETLAKQIPILTAGQKIIPFPLPEGSNPIDLAMLNDDYRRMHMAIQARQDAEARQHLEILLKRYPTSDNLKILAATEPALNDPARPPMEADDHLLDPSQPAAQQVARLEARAKRSLSNGDIKAGIGDLESAIDPRICPADFTRHREMLAKAYVGANRLDEAERIYREIYPLVSDSIDSVQGYESLLNERGKFEDAEKVTERVYELEDIYRR